MTDTDIAALVERLRGNWAHLSPDDAEEAADALEACQAENELTIRARDALALAIEQANGAVVTLARQAIDTRNDALEEAAQVAEDMAEGYGILPAVARVAEAIRALKEKASD